MPSVHLVDRARPFSSAVVIGAFSSASGPSLAPGAGALDAELGGRLLAALKATGASGAADEVTRIPTLGLIDSPLVVVAGLGPRQDDLPAAAEAIRRGVGAALRTLKGHTRVRVSVGDPSLAGAAAEGALFGSYRFTPYKSGAESTGIARIDLAVDGRPDSATRAAIRRATAVGSAVALTRDLVNTPPNDLYPASFADRLAGAATAAGLEVQVLDERALKRGGYGGILGVGAGSVRPPRLVRISYRPAKPKVKLALVGKGITFDSGGLNIKTAMMSIMKSDMGGAAAAAAAVIAIAELGLPIEVTATLPMAENMPSGSSYRPSDVLTMRSGKTVEVADTDAEGRLILADGITRAAEDNPDYLVEVSTLTGGQMVSLGMRIIGAMGEPGFRDQVAAAGSAAGEPVWAMPLPAELRSGLDSPVADLVNLPSDRWASMLVAGVFLGEFVPDGLPWVHLDIAGPSFNIGAPYGYTPKGATGSGVRTIVATAACLAG